MPPEIQDQQIPQPPEIEQPNRASGVAALFLVGIAAFFMVYAYFESTVPTPTQTAAAAAAPSAFDALTVTARSAIVVDLNSGTVLYEKNPDVQLPLASITKVPLALAVSEVLDPNMIVTIPYDTAYAEGAQRLLKGERWTVSDIMKFTLVASSNEGAQILADAAESRLHASYASSTPGTSALWRMNDLAKGLGLTRTYFLNVSGLDESESQSGAYGSARDIAKLFAYAATTRPEVFAATAKDGLLLYDQDGQTTAAFNTNEALGQIPGLIMGKTGYTDLAGGNLAIVFDAGLSQPIVAVVLGSTLHGRFSDMRVLVEAAREDIGRE